jgi:hypothetical protein
LIIGRGMNVSRDMLQCMSPLVARNGRAGRPPSSPLLGVQQPRERATAEAACDPERQFATVKCRNAKGSIRGSGTMEYRRGDGTSHSGLMLAARITLLHLSA